MYLFVFQEKLAKLGARLYVDTSSAQHVGGEWKVAPIRLRKGRADSKKSLTSVISGDAARFLEAHESGNIDEVVGACPTEWVPEYDIFDPAADRPKILARGWRTTIRGLVLKGLVKMDKAKRVFGNSIGDSRYDNLSMEQKWAIECPRQAEEARATSFTDADARRVRAENLAKSFGL